MENNNNEKVSITYVQTNLLQHELNDCHDRIFELEIAIKQIYSIAGEDDDIARIVNDVMHEYSEMH